MDQARLLLNLLKASSANAHKTYTEWIKKNPSRASNIEVSLNVISYLLHGRFKNSNILPELLYCSSNLLAFWHDCLFKAEAERRTVARASYSRNGIAGSSKCSNGRDRLIGHKEVHRIKVILTTLEYFEVFLEVSARRIWGEPGRWVVIVVVQVIKTILRGALLFYFKGGMIESPALQPYDRRNSQVLDPSSPSPNLVFILKHSGRVVRKIHASPPISARSWKLPAVPNMTTVPQDLPPLRLLAEIIHVVRPLSHLVGLGLWGTASWKPWLLSLVMDMSSLQLHGVPTGLKAREKVELTRRTYALFYYLIRSPFYDRYTKRRLLTTLLYFSRRIPLLGPLCTLVAEAIPEWQGTYSYVWNDV